MLSFTEPAVTLTEVEDYLSASNDAWEGDTEAKEAAIIRGQRFIAGAYNHRWRITFDNDDAPQNVKFAIAEAARRELAEPGSMSPDLARGGAIRAVGAGSARVEYFDKASSRTTFTAIDGLLRGLVSGIGGAGNIALVRA